MTLKTRRPTGAVSWPLILIEGEEKAGKTWSCAELTASDKVGRCYWIDMGEGAADEYGAIPGADYEIVEHDGSWSALYQNVAEIHAAITASLADLGLRLHGFGVKSAGLSAYSGDLASADSMSWSARGRRTAGCAPGHRSEANCLRFASAWRRKVLAAIPSEVQMRLPLEGDAA